MQMTPDDMQQFADALGAVISYSMCMGVFLGFVGASLSHSLRTGFYSFRAWRRWKRRAARRG